MEFNFDDKNIKVASFCFRMNSYLNQIANRVNEIYLKI
jgi:hypothetical protein